MISRPGPRDPRRLPAKLPPLAPVSAPCPPRGLLEHGIPPLEADAEHRRQARPGPPHQPPPPQERPGGRLPEPSGSFLRTGSKVCARLVGSVDEVALEAKLSRTEPEAGGY